MNLLSLLAVLSMSIYTHSVMAEVKTAVFAGGCFWCVQADFDKLLGVVKTEVGYDGGSSLFPNYTKVSSGETDHLEVVKVWYDNEILSYRQTINYFFKLVDPSVKERQFCDVGKQYQSAILYQNELQATIANVELKKLKLRFNNPIYIKLLASTIFSPGEEYHQKYYLKNPFSYVFYRWQCGRDARLEYIWGE